MDQIAKGVDPKLKPLFKNLRSLIRQALPNALETVRMGVPFYTLERPDVAYLAVYLAHINLGFWKGAHLKSKPLEGTGKDLRHIRLRSPADIK